MGWLKKNEIYAVEKSHPTAKNSSKLVMLVDDNETDNFISKHIIEIAGFAAEIEVMGSGEKALQYLIENQEVPERIPNFIFLDINMPTVDGFTFLYEFEKLGECIKRKSKVVILSSSDNKNDINKIISSGRVVRFITKPLNKESLTQLQF